MRQKANTKDVEKRRVTSASNKEIKTFDHGSRYDTTLTWTPALAAAESQGHQLSKQTAHFHSPGVLHRESSHTWPLLTVWL